MQLHLTSDERGLIEATLRFANLRSIKSTRQVEDLFLATPLVQATARTFGRLQPHEVAKYRDDDQRILKEALAGIASGDPAERQRWFEHASGTLRDTAHLSLARVKGRLIFGYELTGVMAATWLAVAFLLDEGRGLTNRLGQCRKPGCGRFNLTFHGKRRIFCKTEHRLAYDRSVATERVRKWRDDLKQRQAAAERARAERAAQTKE
jgi:hypothetical protein